MTTGYNDIASKYNDNLKQMKKGLDSLEHSINKSIDSIYQRKHNPNIFQKIFASYNNKSIENLKNRYQQAMGEWAHITGTDYPNVLNDKGKEITYDEMSKQMEPYLKSKDGYYHIPDELCTSGFLKEMKKDLDDYFKENKSGIPIEIGQKLEEIYKSPGKTWIHRTQIDIDHTKLLSDIGNHGLICTANDIENTATPCSSFPFFVSQLVYSYQYRQGTCLGDVILKTNGEPDITDGRIDSNHVVGYIGNDHGNLHDLISREEMATLQPQELSHESVSPDPGYVDKLIQNARDELLSENIDLQIKTGPELETEPELA